MGLGGRDDGQSFGKNLEISRSKEMVMGGKCGCCLLEVVTSGCEEIVTKSKL